MYSVPCNLRLPILLGKYGLKLKVVLKWQDMYIYHVYTENIKNGVTEGWSQNGGNCKIEGS